MPDVMCVVGWRKIHAFTDTRIRGKAPFSPLHLPRKWSNHSTPHAHVILFLLSLAKKNGYIVQLHGITWFSSHSNCRISSLSLPGSIEGSVRRFAARILFHSYWLSILIDPFPPSDSRSTLERYFRASPVPFSPSLSYSSRCSVSVIVFLLLRASPFLSFFQSRIILISLTTGRYIYERFQSLSIEILCRRVCYETHNRSETHIQCVVCRPCNWLIRLDPRVSWTRQQTE